MRQVQPCFPVAFSCRVLGVSRSGYYRWAQSSPSPRAQADVKLAAEVRDVHREHRGRYGSPRVHRELRARGRRVSRKRVARLMRQEGLCGRAPRRFRHTTDSRHGHRIAANLLARDVSAEAPNRAWVGDMTYVPTCDGWLYLAVHIDLFSRRVVGWAMSDHIDTKLALKAPQDAASHRHPEPGLIHHTDRDCRYASDDYQLALRNAGMICSMSGKADCWDSWRLLSSQTCPPSRGNSTPTDEPVNLHARTEILRLPRAAGPAQHAASATQRAPWSPTTSALSLIRSSSPGSARAAQLHPLLRVGGFCTTVTAVACGVLVDVRVRSMPGLGRFPMPQRDNAASRRSPVHA